jgi:hypothetical protein
LELLPEVKKKVEKKAKPIQPGTTVVKPNQEYRPVLSPVFSNKENNCNIGLGLP